MWCRWGTRKSYVDGFDAVLCLQDDILVSCDSETCCLTHVLPTKIDKKSNLITCGAKGTKRKLPPAVDLAYKRVFERLAQVLKLMRSLLPCLGNYVVL